MALEICACDGVGQLPPLTVGGARSLVAAGRAAVRSPAQAVRGRITAEVRAQLPPGVPLSPREAVGAVKQLGRQEAEKLKGELLRAANLPNLRLSLPADLTPEAISQSVYANTKPILEKEIQNATGLPLKLPAKVSVKELGRTVGGLIPKDFEGALDLGLALGTQAAAGALTSLLVGAGIGSVIPGLGTVVGVAVGLAVMALKGVVKDLLTEKRGQKCNTPFGCPKTLPSNISSLEALVWMTPYYIGAYQTQARTCGFPQRIVDQYVSGPTVECQNFMWAVGLKVFELGAAKTPFEMGLPQLARLIPQYEQALVQWRSVPGRPDGFKTGGQDSMRLILDRMKARRIALLTLGARANQALASGNRSEISSVMFLVVEELKKAALQAALAPGPDTLGWFKGVLDYANRLKAADVGAQQVMHAKLARTAARAAELTAKDPQGVRIATLRSGCIIGDQRSCEELRKIPGAAVPSSVPGSPAPRPVASRPQTPQVPVLRPPVIPSRVILAPRTAAAELVRYVR